MKLLLS